MLGPIVLFASELPPGKAPLAEETAAARDGRSKIRILVVDDEVLIAETIAEILNQNGFEAYTATSAEDAIHVAMRTVPDIVLSDVVMPRMSGVELGIEIRKELPGTRVLLISGQSSTSDLLRRGAESGHSFELVPKPIHPEDLIARLTDVKHRGR